MRRVLLRPWSGREGKGSMMDEMKALDLLHTKAFLHSGCSDAPAPTLLVLGGRSPSSSWLWELSQVLKGKVWALDRGADVCKAAGLTPHRLLGDLDSISQNAYDWAKAAGALVDRYPPDKNLTDFQLALQLLESPIVVTGCWGGRFDHLFSLLFSVLKAADWGVRTLALIDEREALFPLHGPSSLTLEFSTLPESLSLLPLTRNCEGVSAEGVRWPLEDVTLEQKWPWAVSNIPRSSARFKVAKGVLGVYAAFEEC
ncbi:MAG: thiamine diphosphokinase [Fretibacterium sp.]|nr:thiamine diphosphokinase [Fretibacterium sp.]